MAIIQWEDTLACLEIEPLGADRFTAPNIPMEYRRVFGGQLLAQGLCVAAGSVEGKAVKSIHATFPAEGELAERVEYRLDRLGEGRTYAHRVVRGEQGDRTIMVAAISLHGEEGGLLPPVRDPRSSRARGSGPRRSQHDSVGNPCGGRRRPGEPGSRAGPVCLLDAHEFLRGTCRGPPGAARPCQ